MTRAIDCFSIFFYPIRCFYKWRTFRNKRYFQGGYSCWKYHKYIIVIYVKRYLCTYLTRTTRGVGRYNLRKWNRSFQLPKTKITDVFFYSTSISNKHFVKRMPFKNITSYDSQSQIKHQDFQRGYMCTTTRV